jgi:3-hydroxybutyryl-CoA dehydrogenase
MASAMRLVDAPDWPQTVAVVGGGRMGSGIAEAFVAGGLRVRITDADPDLSTRARERVIARARSHVEAGLIDAALLDRAQDVTACGSISEATSGAELVLEAVAEDMEVKHAVLAEVEETVSDEVIIATNTSSLPVDRLAEPLRHPARLLGMHWFNPPEWTPGVEVVAAPRTDPSVVERVVAFLRALGKAPAVVQSSVGFVSNRLQMALLCEAARCVQDGIATPEEIDQVARSTFGFRLPFFGPFQIADMAGLDVYSAVLQQHRDGLGDRFFVPEPMRERVDSGETGTSSGAGLYAYEDGEPERILSERDERYAALAQLLERLPPQRFTPRSD